MNWLDELAKIAPPPPPEDLRGPSATEADWARVEASLGVCIPEDYKAFVALYGDSSIEEEFNHFLPVLPSRYLRLPEATERAIWAYDEMRLSSPRHWPMPKFPAPGSFFPIGVTGNGDYFGWVIGEGKPETWQTSVPR